MHTVKVLFNLLFHIHVVSLIFSAVVDTNIQLISYIKHFAMQLPGII